MTCPHCQTDDTQKLAAATDLGYCRFRCRQCGRRFNERTGTPFNYLEFPTDIVFQVVLFRLRYKTYLKVKGKWCYLDREGNLVDSLRSATRDMAAAQRLFCSTLSVVNEAPKQVTTDDHDSYPRAIR